jgi:hypothetical protein
MKNKKQKLQRRRTRKFRKDIRVRTLRMILGLKKEAIRNPDGSIARGNKKLATLRAEYES